MIIHSPIISGSLTFAEGAIVTYPDGGSYSGSFSGSLTVHELNSHIIPNGNEIYDLGSTTNRFRDIYLSNGTMRFPGGGVGMNDDGEFTLEDNDGNPAAVISSEIKISDPISGDIIVLKSEGGQLKTSATNSSGTAITDPTSNLSGSFTGSFLGEIISTNGIVSSSNQVDLENVQGDTDDVSEGSSNLYFTDERVKTKLNTEGVISGSSQITITESQISDLVHYTDSDVKTKLNAEGVLSGSSQVDLENVQGDTDDVSEGSTNLYFTDARATSALSSHTSATDNPHSVTKSQVGLGNVTNESKATMFTSPTFTGTVSGVTKSHVGLGNVDNTSDSSKPISTATQTALDGKLNINGDGVISGSSQVTLTQSQISDVTATAAEINKLDGVTATTTELNILDGVTATAAEINKLDGVTATTAELNFVDGVTSNIQTQLNSKQSAGSYVTTTSDQSLKGTEALTLSGNTLTLTKGDDSTDTIDLSAYLDEDSRSISSGTLNGVSGIVTFTRDDASTFTLDLSDLLDDTNLVTSVNGRNGVVTTSLSDYSITATAAEINKLDGVTATTAELNFVDGVTSNIQTQLNGKQGTITTGIADNNIVEIDDSDVATNDYAKFTANGLQGRSYSEVKSDLSLNNVTNESKATMFTSPTFTGTVSGVTKSHVGLGNVENTALSTYTGENGALDNQYITNGAGYITSFTNTQLSDENVQDIVGGMVSGNSESGITVTYQDADGTLDFSVTSQTDNNFTNTLKTKLDGIAESANNYSLPLGTSSVRGGFKLGYTESGKNYPVEQDGEKLYVNVPWVDTNTNTTYSAGTGITLSGTTFSIGQSVGTGDNVTFGTVRVDDATASTTKTTGALIVDGGVGIAGALNVGGDVVAYASSDKRLKDNIVNIENPIEKVQKLNGVTWDWNGNADELQQSLPNVGVIAQEVEEVFPQLVHDRDNGYKGVDYAKLTGLLIEAVKEQQKQIDELKSRLG